MFNKKVILLVIIFSLFVTSCTNYFNPYDVKNKTSSENDENIEPLPNGKSKMILTFTSIGFRNINSKSAYRNAITGNADFFGELCNYAYFGYDMKVDWYTSSTVKHSLSSFAKLSPKDMNSALNLTLPDHDVGIFKEILLSKSYSLLYDDTDDMTLIMSVNLTKYDVKSLDPRYKLYYPYAYSENDKIKIKFTYNKTDSTFVLDSITDGYGNRIKAKTSNLIVKQNKEGRVYIRMDGMDGPANERHCKKGPTGWNNEIELTIKFKFEIK
uniref:hypothetical protein n=1 Tax=Brachyspira catarrhinii TaxID=2528966 RepID=UPI003F4BCC27